MVLSIFLLPLYRYISQLWTRVRVVQASKEEVDPNVNVPQDLNGPPENQVKSDPETRSGRLAFSEVEMTV